MVVSRGLMLELSCPRRPTALGAVGKMQPAPGAAKRRLP